MSIKTTLTNPPTLALIALQIIGGLLILASIVGFRSSGMLWPMLGSGAGTWLLILGWERTREKLAALQEDQKIKRRYGWLDFNYLHQNASLIVGSFAFSQ